MPPTSEPVVHISDGSDYDNAFLLDNSQPCMPGPHQSMMMPQSHREDTKQRSVTPYDTDAEMGDDIDGDKSEPYAKSLFRCLRSAPNHTMILRDIYDWFRGNTDKGQDPHERGWQNSIRHNLSMNKVRARPPYALHKS